VETRPCPYCSTPVVPTAKDEERCHPDGSRPGFVNGVKPADPDATGCEFCKPLPLEASSDVDG
jgi:hypothetical protein